MMKDKMYIPGSVNDAPLVLTMTRSSTYQSQSQVEAKTEFREILSDYFLFQRSLQTMIAIITVMMIEMVPTDSPVIDKGSK